MAEELIDYIRWRGDLTFELDPFNEVDNAVLCELSYVDFSKVLPYNSPDGISLREAYEEIKNQNCFRLMTAFGGDDAFAAAAAQSKRFGSLVLTYYNDIFNKDVTQFSSIHFELNDTLSYVAFRGTDNSIIGWKEDFMMSFRKVPAQRLACNFLRMSMNEKRNYYIGGHSKGGNLAIYAVAALSEELRSHILQIYANDSPGFSPDVYDMEAIHALEPLIIRNVPEFYIIGQLFNQDVQGVKYVSSTANGILQHDLMTWKVMGNSFQYVPDMDSSAKLQSNALNTWISKVDEESRKAFVNSLFDSLSVKGAIKFEDIKVRYLPEVVKAMMQSGPEALNVAMDLPVTYFNVAKKQVTEILNAKAEDAAKEKNKSGKKKH